MFFGQRALLTSTNAVFSLLFIVIVPNPNFDLSCAQHYWTNCFIKIYQVLFTHIESSNSTKTSNNGNNYEQKKFVVLFFH